MMFVYKKDVRNFLLLLKCVFIVEINWLISNFQFKDNFLFLKLISII